MGARIAIARPARTRAGPGSAASRRAWGRSVEVPGPRALPSLQSGCAEPGRAGRTERGRPPGRLRAAGRAGLGRAGPRGAEPGRAGPGGEGRGGDPGREGTAGGGEAVAGAAELLLGAFCTKMAAPTVSKAASLGCNNKPAFPELDFRSGARVEELNKLIQEFTKHDQREYDDQRALEIHTAKDFIFSMLGKEEKGEACVCARVRWEAARRGEPAPAARRSP